MPTLGKVIPLALILIAASFSDSSVARRRYRKMPLDKSLSAELNKVLRSANEMHTAFVEKDEKKIEASLISISKNLNRANQKSSLANDQKHHLMKMINATKVKVDVVRNSAGQQRRQNLKEAMSQIVQIAQTYQLDKYKIFFCPKDRAVWLQKSWKAKNPVNPDTHGKCGKLVR